ncbi:Uncharacterised protein [Enterobacter cloacae]|uniref:Ead/Ea22-like family protein n=2 Tax=Enterobacter cloacae TaxID=550 RepID=A0A377LY49_ENTCL|nr:Uncharacterised protein [Enterobacter cloacae]
MSVNRYEWVACDEHACHCDVVESAEGDMVDYEDYAALEARCSALAAENAGLKSIQEWAVADVFKTGAKRFESTKAAGFDTDDCLHDAVLVMLSELQTPATDAFLAEVRAHDLNAFIRHHSAELDAHIKTVVSSSTKNQYASETSSSQPACSGADSQGGRPMSNIDKRALREAAEKASTDNHTQDEWFHYLRCSTPETVLALLDELEKMQAQSSKWCEAFHKAVSVGARYEERIAELERNEIREEGNQFLVVRHPGKLPVVKHCAGELEGFLRQLLEHDPMATIDIVTHRYYGVGGQWVQDADEYLQMMAAAAGKGEAS